MAANDRTAVGSGSGDWRTPPALYAELNRRWHFDYDMWASHENALAERYSTAEGTFHRHAHPVVAPCLMWGCTGLPYQQISSETGMEYTPHERRGFGNPPFTRGLIAPAIQHAIDVAGDMECLSLLVPASTETEWFQHAYEAFGEPIWLPRRVKFIHPPVRCVNRKGVECTHELNAPAPDAPSGMCIFEANIPKARWLAVL